MQKSEVNKVKYLLEKLRTITLVVQIIPFVYTAVFIVVYALSFSPNETLLSLLDMFFYVSPMMIAFLLIESRVLKLCKWHKTACVLPLIPQIPIIINNYFVELTDYEVRIFLVCILSMSVLLLVAAYKVFFCK